MNTDVPKDKKWRDYLVAIVVAVITGIFGLRAAGESTRLAIYATQTAEARLTYTPTVNANATAIYKGAISTQQAFASTQQAFNATQQAFYVTSTAIANLPLYPQTPALQPTKQQPVTNLNNLPTFYNFYSYILFAWFIFALSQPLPRKRLLKTIMALSSEPNIFKHSENNQIRFYPRSLLEHAATGIKNFYEKLNKNPFLEKPKNLVEQVTGETYTYSFEQVMILVVFIFLLYADAVQVQNNLKVLGLIGTVPQWLTYYWVAPISGTIVSTMVGSWLIAKKGTLKNPISLYSGYFLVISGLGLALLFSLVRYVELGFISSAYINLLPQAETLIINLLIPINIFFATAAIFIPAYSTLIKLAIPITGSLLFIIGTFIALTLSLFLLMIDFQIRFTLIYIQVIFFLTLSPLDLFFGKFYGWQKAS